MINERSLTIIIKQIFAPFQVWIQRGPYQKLVYMPAPVCWQRHILLQPMAIWNAWDCCLGMVTMWGGNALSQVAILWPNWYKILWLYLTFYNMKGLVKSMLWYVRVWAKALILIAAYHVTPGTCWWRHSAGACWLTGCHKCLKSAGIFDFFPFKWLSIVV